MASASNMPTVKPVGLPARPRLWLVHAVMVVIVGGSFFDIVTGREHWPFSPYPMYASIIRVRTLTGLRLCGVTGGVPAEVPLTAYPYLQPFQPAKLELALSRLYRPTEPMPRGLVTTAPP